MHCRDLERHLEAYLDGEVAEADHAALCRHLAACRRCSAKVAAIREVESRLQVALSETEPSPGFWERIESDSETLKQSGSDLVDVRHRSAPTSGRRRRRQVRGHPLLDRPPRRAHARRWIGQAATAAVLVVLGLGIYAMRTTDPHAPTPAVALEAVGEYRAYVDGGRQLDIVTDDAGALAAWFGERMTVTPPPPPEGAGATLIGGRLAHMTGRPAAAYIYAFGGGEAALYVMSGAGLDAAAQAEPPQAPGHVAWRAGESLFVLVADAPTGQLRALADAFRPSD